MANIKKIENKIDEYIKLGEKYTGIAEGEIWNQGKELGERGKINDTEGRRCEKCGKEMGIGEIYIENRGREYCEKCNDIHRNRYNTKYDFDKATKGSIVGAEMEAEKIFGELSLIEIKGIINKLREGLDRSIMEFMKAYKEISEGKSGMERYIGKYDMQVAFYKKLIELGTKTGLISGTRYLRRPSILSEK